MVEALDFCWSTMEKAAQIIHDHFNKKFRLQMHVGSNESKSKTEAMMYFPSSLKEAVQNTENKPSLKN